MSKFEYSEMGGIIVDKYRTCDFDDSKTKYYEKHVLTEEEKQKTEAIREALSNYIKIVSGEGNKSIDASLSIAKHIEFFDGRGYLLIAYADRGWYDVYYYGRTFDKAFLNAIVDYERSVTPYYELIHRQELNKQFSNRFLDGNYSKDSYHGPFFFAELALQDFRKFFGDNIPEELVSYYERYVLAIGKMRCKYDYETNSFIEVGLSLKRSE